jgi:hypothetical protein
MNFLDLPPNLRTQIYKHLIFSAPLDPHSSLTAFHANDPYQRLFRHSASIAEANIERLIHYPSRVYLGFEGLLRVSRGVRKEVQRILKTYKREVVDCSLDIIIDAVAGGGRGGLWPTWLLCPARNPRVGRLEVDVRVFGGDEFAVEVADGHGPVLLREFSDGALEFAHAHFGRERVRTLAFAVVAVIARFIERGARWGHVRDEITIETLVLNFVEVRPRMEEKEDRFLELMPLTPIDSNSSPDGTEDYWDTDTLHGEVDEGISFGLADSRLQTRIGDDGGTAPARTSDDSIEATELLRMVDLILKPLCREEKYMLPSRQNHFSAVHLAFMRRNVGRVIIELGGKLKRRMKVTW